MVSSKWSAPNIRSKCDYFSATKNFLSFNFTFNSYGIRTIGTRRSTVAAIKTIETSRNMKNLRQIIPIAPIILNSIPWNLTVARKNPHHHSHHHKGVASLHQGMVAAIPKGIELQRVARSALATRRLLA